MCSYLWMRDDAITILMVHVFMEDTRGISVFPTIKVVVLANLVLSQRTEPNISGYRLDCFLSDIGAYGLKGMKIN